MDIYDLDQVEAIFLGVPCGNGYSEGGSLKIEKVNPDFKFKEGADGRVVRSKTNSKLYKCTLSYMQTCPVNDALSAINQVDVRTPNGAGVGSFVVTDLQGTTLFVSTQAWLEGPPPTELGAEATAREWVIYAADGNLFVGGNA